MELVSFSIAIVRYYYLIYLNQFKIEWKVKYFINDWNDSIFDLEFVCILTLHLKERKRKNWLYILFIYGITALWVSFSFTFRLNSIHFNSMYYICRKNMGDGKWYSFQLPFTIGLNSCVRKRKRNKNHTIAGQHCMTDRKKLHVPNTFSI